MKHLAITCLTTNKVYHCLFNSTNFIDFGRDDKCAIKISDKTWISRIHCYIKCEIELDKGEMKWYLIDTSKYGTLYNSQRLKKGLAIKLSTNSTITLGFNVKEPLSYKIVFDDNYKQKYNMLPSIYNHFQTNIEHTKALCYSLTNDYHDELNYLRLNYNFTYNTTTLKKMNEYLYYFIAKLLDNLCHNQHFDLYHNENDLLSDTLQFKKEISISMSNSMDIIQREYHKYHPNRTILPIEFKSIHYFINYQQVFKSFIMSNGYKIIYINVYLMNI